MRRGMEAARAQGLRGATARVVVGSLALVGAACGPGAASASIEGGWVGLGVRVSATQLDDRLADYQWDVTPRAAWGAEAAVGRGRFGAGLRLEATRTVQDVGSSSGTPAVHRTTLELVGRGRLASRWGVAVLASASAGWLHLGYHPDRMAIESGSGTLVVDFEPIDTWVAGGGLMLERPLGGPWLVSFEIDHRVFDLDTAHRNGTAIAVGRERFGDWNARLGLSRVWGRR